MLFVVLLSNSNLVTIGWGV